MSEDINGHLLLLLLQFNGKLQRQILHVQQ